MIKRLPPYFEPNGAEIEKLEINNWIWNSHFWIEYVPGCFRCKWCDLAHDSNQHIDDDFPICEKNPAIIKLLNF